MIQLVVARPRVHFILLVHSYLFNLLSLSLPGKASPPLFDIKSRLTFAIQIKVTARAWWIWVFPPFSLLLSDQRPISLATITNLTFFHFRRRHINILTIPSQKLMWLVVFIKPFLLCSESFFLCGRIDSIFHTRINHNLKVCLVVVLFHSAKKCQNYRTLKHFIGLVPIYHLVQTVSQRPFVGLNWNYTHALTITWRCASSLFYSIRPKKCQNCRTLKHLLVLYVLTILIWNYTHAFSIA